MTSPVKIPCPWKSLATSFPRSRLSLCRVYGSAAATSDLRLAAVFVFFAAPASAEAPSLVPAVLAADRLPFLSSVGGLGVAC